MFCSAGMKISLGLGLAYLAIGVLGFIPGITVPSSAPGQGLLLGIFAVNTIHNLAHLGLGAALVWPPPPATACGWSTVAWPPFSPSLSSAA